METEFSHDTAYKSLLVEDDGYVIAKSISSTSNKLDGEAPLLTDTPCAPPFCIIHPLTNPPL